MIAIHVNKSASRGIVIGKAFLAEKPHLETNFGNIEEQEVQKEISRYEKAVAKAEADLEVLSKTNSIFAAHLEMVKDIALYESVITKIKEEHLCAEAALEAATAEFILIFESMEDEYMRERAADVKVIRFRLLCGLQEVKMNPFEDIKEEIYTR
jgi:phosphotransferase system enzyme I (PtsI)